MEWEGGILPLKFWTIMSLPLVSFLSASAFVSPDYEHSLLYDALLVLAALTAGGIAFLIMARSMKRATSHHFSRIHCSR
jgi:hypothetical protein